jgi:hypothetical protein
VQGKFTSFLAKKSILDFYLWVIQQDGFKFSWDLTTQEDWDEFVAWTANLDLTGVDFNLDDFLI